MDDSFKQAQEMVVPFRSS